MQLKETKWQEQLKGLFDIAHAEAMNIITIEEDKKFLLQKKKQTVRACLVQLIWHYTNNRPEVERDKKILSEEKLKQKTKKYKENNKYNLETSSEEEDAPLSAIIDGEVPALENVCASSISTTSQTLSSASKPLKKRRQENINLRSVLMWPS